MNQYTALLQTILEAPDEDTPRLIFADHLEIDCGENALADFIRVQVELAARQAKVEQSVATLAKAGMTVHEFEMGPQVEKLRRRERELHPQGSIEDVKIAELFGLRGATYAARAPDWPRWEYHRGFLSSIRCDWNTFLSVHERLVWSPGKPSRMASGAIIPPRPFTDELAATVQPLERVELTDTPLDNGHSATLSDDGNTLDTGRRRFERMECAMCVSFGWTAGGPCPEDHPTANAWRCDRWPGITFALPQPWDDPYPHSGNPNWRQRLDAAARERAAAERAERAYVYGDVGLGTRPR